MDRFPKEVRSRIMRSIRSRDTRPELLLLAALRTVCEREGFAMVREPKAPGRPDFQLLSGGVSLMVFCHGCFWHKCPKHFRLPKTDVGKWRAHFDSNVRRDVRVRRKLRLLGDATAVVWEHDLKDAAGAERAAARLARRFKKLLTP